MWRAVRRSNTAEGGIEHVAAMKAAVKEGKSAMGDKHLLVPRRKAVPTSRMDDILIE